MSRAPLDLGIEARQFTGSDAQRLAQLRDRPPALRRRVVRGALPLYQRFLIECDATLRRELADSSNIQATFRSLTLPQNYEILRKLHRAS